MSISLIFLLTILPHMAFASARITMSLFALHLGATPFTVGMIISLIAVVPMFCSVRWGIRAGSSCWVTRTSWPP